MGIHGVDEDEQIKKSTQKELYALVKDSGRLVYF
jgi:hypothetical protein